MNPGLSACEADTLPLSYTPFDSYTSCRVIRVCHLVADPFIDERRFFIMLDATKAVNPFLDRIPKELHGQYLTNYLTAQMKLKMSETNNNYDDGVNLGTYGLVVAFARKT